MAGQADESSSGLERTDEYPVLSEEAVRRLEQGGQAGAGNTLDALDASVDALRAALERAENRWRQLETRLETQDRAIDELRSALGKPDSGRPARPPVPELTDIVRILPGTEAAEAQQAEGEPPPVSAEEPAAAAEIVSAETVTAAPAVGPLLERIAALEAYITGRGDHWRAMEAEVAEKARRIAELEQELEQRIAREENLKQQLEQESGRSDNLRERLQRANLRLETLVREEIDVSD